MSERNQEIIEPSCPDTTSHRKLVGHECPFQIGCDSVLTAGVAQGTLHMLAGMARGRARCWLDLAGEGHEGIRPTGHKGDHHCGCSPGRRGPCGPRQGGRQRVTQGVYGPPRPLHPPCTLRSPRGKGALFAHAVSQGARATETGRSRPAPRLCWDTVGTVPVPEQRCPGVQSARPDTGSSSPAAGFENGVSRSH